MKKILLLQIILFVTFYVNSENIISQNNHKYLITSIVSVNSCYIIYAQKRDILYKIVTSKSENCENCNKIVVGNYYDLDLKSKEQNIPKINGITLRPVNYLDVNCYSYTIGDMVCYIFNNDTICTEPNNGIYDLYYTNDIKGLCYLK